jgi:tetratricopeptide (TPR) repeat protein
MEALSRRWWWALLALTALTGLLYALPLWGADFAWDDGALVADNALTGSLANWAEILRADLWRTTRLPAPSSGYYRPLFLLHLALDRALFGLSVDAHHLVSLAWHLGAVVLLALLLRRLVGDGPALLGAAFFALHPVQIETVALIAARNDSMAAVLLLAALLALLPQRAGPWRLAGGALACFAALASKESAVLAPAFLLALDLARWGRPRGWPRYLALVCGVAAYAGLRLWAGVGAAAVPEGGELGTVASKALHIGAVYGSLISWPWPLTPARHVDWLPPIDGLMLGCLLTLAAITVALALARQRRLVLAGLAMALLAFLPSLAATFDKGLLGERYLYLPMAGLALALAAAVPLHRRVLLVAAPLLLACGLVLQLRLPAWQDSATLWRAADDSASSPFTKGGLAWYLRRDGQPEQALELVVGAIRDDPPYLDACPFLGMIPLEMNKPKQAVELAAWGLEQRGCPPSVELLGSMAVGLAGVGRWEQAMALARRPELQGPSTGWIVTAAGMALQGDQEPLQRYAAQWPGGPEDFQRRVVKLLQKSGLEVRSGPPPQPQAAP